MSAPLPWAANVFYTPTQLCQRYELLYQATTTQPNQDNDPATDLTHIYWDVYDPGGGGNVVTSVVADIGITVTGGDTAAPQIGTNLVAGDGIQILPGVGTTLGISNTGILSVDTGGAGITATTVSGNTTLNNSGVTSVIAGTAVSVSAATGAVTLTNTGVTSVIAGSGINVSSPAGAVTISASAGFTPTTQVLLAQQLILPGQTGVFSTPSGGEGLYIIMGCSVPASTGQSRQGQFSVWCYVNSSQRVQMGGSGLSDLGALGSTDIMLLIPQDGTTNFFYSNGGSQSLVNYSIVAFKMSGPISGAF